MSASGGETCQGYVNFTLTPIIPVPEPVKVRHERSAGEFLDAICFPAQADRQKNGVEFDESAEASFLGKEVVATDAETVPTSARCPEIDGTALAFCRS